MKTALIFGGVAITCALLALLLRVARAVCEEHLVGSYYGGRREVVMSILFTVECVLWAVAVAFGVAGTWTLIRSVE